MLARDKLLVNIAATSMLGVMALLMFSSAWNDVSTFDESTHLIASYSYLRKQEYRLGPQVPPLMKDWAAFPLLFMNLHEPWSEKSWTEAVNGQEDLGRKFIYNLGNDADAILRVARTPMILFTLALGWIMFWWVRRQFDQMVALLALFFYVFSPTFLAHGRFVTTDVGAAAGFFVGTIAFLQFLKTPTKRNVALAGLAIGFALLTKFTTIALVPISGILVGAWVLVHYEPGKRFRGIRRYLLPTLEIFLVAYILVYALYLHHTWNYTPERQQADAIANLKFSNIRLLPEPIAVWAADKPGLRPFAEYFLGIVMALQESAQGNNPFFWGKISPNGVRIYFPFVYLVKEPLALHLLAIIALVFALSRIRWPLYRRKWMEEHFTEFAFIVVIVFYWWMSIRSNLNMGVRHLLPMFPFIYILIANEILVLYRRLLETRTGIRLHSKGQVRHSGVLSQPSTVWIFGAILGALLCWQMATVLRVHPSYLAYFNEIAGGPNGGYRYVTDSNLDWGQDLKRLSQYVEKHGIAQINLDYFGKADPAYYLNGKYRESSGCGSHGPGWLAVSAMLYPGSPWAPQCDYRRWLPMDQVATKIGYSIYVFDLRQSSLIHEESTMKTQPFVFKPEQLLGVDLLGGTVEWSARSIQSVTNARLYVQIDGRAEQLVAQDLEGTRKEPWILEGHKYVFELYDTDGKIKEQLLARVIIDEQGNVSASALHGTNASRKQTSRNTGDE